MHVNSKKIGSITADGLAVLRHESNLMRAQGTGTITQKRKVPTTDAEAIFQDATEAFEDEIAQSGAFGISPTEPERILILFAELDEYEVILRAPNSGEKVQGQLASK